MSTVIWKDGKKELCDPLALQSMLNAGYTLTEDGEEAANKNSGDASDDATDELKTLRLEAKDLGIKNANNMKAETLLKKIEEALE